GRWLAAQDRSHCPMDRQCGGHNCRDRWLPDGADRLFGRNWILRAQPATPGVDLRLTRRELERFCCLESLEWQSIWWDVASQPDGLFGDADIACGARLNSDDRVRTAYLDDQSANLSCSSDGDRSINGNFDFSATAQPNDGAHLADVYAFSADA